MKYSRLIIKLLGQLQQSNGSLLINNNWRNDNTTPTVAIQWCSHRYPILLAYIARLGGCSDASPMCRLVHVVWRPLLLVLVVTLLPLPRAATLRLLHTQLLAVDVQVVEGLESALHELAVLELQEGVPVATVPDDAQRVHVPPTHLCLEGAHTQRPWQPTHKQRWLATTTGTEPAMHTLVLNTITFLLTSFYHLTLLMMENSLAIMISSAFLAYMQECNKRTMVEIIQLHIMMLIQCF